MRSLVGPSMQPSIRNTFLSFDDEQAREGKGERRQKKTRSMPMSSTCDRQQLAITSLLYRDGKVPDRMECPQVFLRSEEEDGGISSSSGHHGEGSLSFHHLAPPLTLPNLESASTCSIASKSEPSPSPKASQSLHKRKGWPSSIDLDALQEHHRETLIMAIPRDPVTGEVLSCGSIPHALGSCRPCVFARNDGKQCLFGPSCLYCHFEHESKKRMRKNKKQRAEARAASALKNEIEMLVGDAPSPRPSEGVETADPESIYRDLMNSVMLVCARNFGIRLTSESS